MIRKLQSNQKGFTLIELMIVVAIIGILAAIAIPQFAQYRIRGYNASAQSDIRNITTSEAALFADWQRYGNSQATAGAAFAAVAPIAAAVVLGGDANGDGLATVDNTAAGNPEGVQIPVGNGVGVIAVACTNAAIAVPAAGVNTVGFAAEAKHRNGDTIFAVDSDSSSIYATSTGGAAAAGTALAAYNLGANTSGADQYALAPAASGWQVK